MTFHQPSAWLLACLALLPLLLWQGRRRNRHGAVAFSSIEPLRRAGATWAVRWRWVVGALRYAALALLVVCVARPQKADEHTRIFTEGIAIQLIVDRSGSMLAEDFELDGRRASRLDAVKRIIGEFVAGGDDLPGRPDDLVGLITFATWADSLCPLTLDHDHLIEAVSQTEVSPVEADRATAIGDAIGLAVERMADLERRGDLAPGRITSKVMILLTDGEHNAGDLDPMTAARMAEAFDIRIYTIGAGTAEGFAPVPVTDPFSGRQVMRRMPVSIDEAALREIAEATGGRYFRATDSDSLREVYAQIDELERTTIEEHRYTDYKEIAVEPSRLAGLPVPPLLAVVAALLGIEAFLANTRFRTAP